MSTTSTTTLPVRPPGTTNKPKLINVTESVVLDKNCATGDGAADNDSGYGSAALNTPKTASSGSSDTVPDRNHASAGYPLTTSSDLKVFKKDVDDATWTRYQGSYQAKPRRGLGRLGLIWLESSQVKSSLKPAWLGLVWLGSKLRYSNFHVF